MARGQYALKAPSGAELVIPLEEVRSMLADARALYRDLEEDPRVLYRLDVGAAVPEKTPESAFPWNRLQVNSDSVATVITPGNLREADRAYYNYAVMRMRVVRGEDPDVSCDSLVALEERVVSSFTDGWIVARTLFGSVPFAPLDELAFARKAGHLRGLIAARRDRQLGACADRWAEDHADEVEAFREWRRRSFLVSPVAEEAATRRGDAGPGPDRPQDTAVPELPSP
ncbi:MAG: hypothetical protein ACE5HF_01500 [Gemmatimonadota bacterium]